MDKNQKQVYNISENAIKIFELFKMSITKKNLATLCSTNFISCTNVKKLSQYEIIIDATPFGKDFISSVGKTSQKSEEPTYKSIEIVDIEK